MRRSFVAIVIAFACTFALAAQQPKRDATKPGQPPSKPPAFQFAPVAQDTTIVWNVKDPAQQNLLAARTPQTDLSVRTVPVKSTGGSGPASIIVIFDKDGNVRVCIGRASACKEFLKKSFQDTQATIF
ncbi:MAG TPA: hypothetical protein VLX28_05245 [Thermoanaerobaculia bacterium]|nr:hypothetical protein [Thermoanaerobaculia bacterium]